jgi:hypothetical protein
VRRHPRLVEAGHQIFGDAVVEHALAGDRAALLIVEGARVVLEVLHERAGLGSLEQHFGFAFVDAAAAAHGKSPGEGGTGTKR